MSEHPMPVPKIAFQQAASAVWGKRIQTLVPREHQTTIYRFVGCAYEVHHYATQPLRVSAVCVGIGSIFGTLTIPFAGNWVLWSFAIPVAFGALVFKQLWGKHRERRSMIIQSVARALEHDPEIDMLIAKIGIHNPWRRSRT